MSSALRPSDLEDFTKRRRIVQDLELDAYLLQKANLLQLVNDLKAQNIDQGSDEFKERLKDLETKIILTGKRAIISAEAEELKLEELDKRLESYDATNNERIRELILIANDEYSILMKRLEATTDLLQKRKSINNTINAYLREAKVIKMTRSEVEQLFRDEIEDLSTIFASGRLIYENKQDHSLDKYEFKFDKSKSFQKSTVELREAIDKKIADCAIIKARVETNKAKWVDISTKLSGMLDNITNSFEV